MPHISLSCFCNRSITLCIPWKEFAIFFVSYKDLPGVMIIMVDIPRSGSGWENGVSAIGCIDNDY